MMTSHCEQFKSAKVTRRKSKKILNYKKKNLDISLDTFFNVTVQDICAEKKKKRFTGLSSRQLAWSTHSHM